MPDVWQWLYGNPFSVCLCCEGEGAHLIQKEVSLFGLTAVYMTIKECNLCDGTGVVPNFTCLN